MMSSFWIHYSDAVVFVLAGDRRAQAAQDLKYNANITDDMQIPSIQWQDVVQVRYCSIVRSVNTNRIEKCLNTFVHNSTSGCSKSHKFPLPAAGTAVLQDTVRRLQDIHRS